MSRIILSRYDDGQECVVVGFDHAVRVPGAFLQEFSQEPAVGVLYPVSWTEVTREIGFFDGIPLGEFKRGRSRGLAVR